MITGGFADIAILIVDVNEGIKQQLKNIRIFVLLGFESNNTLQQDGQLTILKQIFKY